MLVCIVAMTLAKLIVTGVTGSYSKFSSAFLTVTSIARFSPVVYVVAAIANCNGERTNKARTAPASN